MRFELYQDADNHWHWRLIDDAGHVVAISAGGCPNKKRVFEIVNLILAMDKADVRDVSK